jgi:hypothetical protein
LFNILLRIKVFYLVKLSLKESLEQGLIVLESIEMETENYVMALKVSLGSILTAMANCNLVQDAKDLCK